MPSPHDPTKPSEPAQSVPRIGPGLEGRAVRLSALAQWLANRDDLAPQDAWGRLFNDLARLEPGAVHWLALDSEGYGQPLPAHDEWFATNNGAPGFANGRRVFSRGIGRYTPPPDPAPSLGRGAEGFASWLRWRTGLRPFLIVAESVARRLWGWGVEAQGTPVTDVPVLAAGDVTDLESLARYRAQFAECAPQRRPPWTPEHTAIVWAAVKELGRGGAGKVAGKLGMSPQNVRDLLQRHTPPKASYFPAAKQA